ncbi:mutator type transposase [Tanacetum coccineum]
MTSQLGVGVLQGLIPLVACGLLNLPFAIALQKYQLQFMRAQDKRLKSTSEILNNMKIIKLQSHCAFRVVAALETEYFEHLLPDIIRNCSHPKGTLSGKIIGLAIPKLLAASVTIHLRCFLGLADEIESVREAALGTGHILVEHYAISVLISFGSSFSPGLPQFVRLIRAVSKYSVGGSVLGFLEVVRRAKNNPNLFTLKVNHGRSFTYAYGPKRTRAPRRVYKDGNADWFDDVDVDGFSVLEVSGMIKELGYDNPEMKFYYKKPTADLDQGLEPLSKDIDVLDMLSYVNKYKLMEVFIEHPVVNSLIDTIDLEQEDASAGLGIANECLGNVGDGLGDENVKNVGDALGYENVDNNEGVITMMEGSDDNDESDDSDFECGIEDKIDDVHVDMQMYKDNIDPNEPQAENNEELVYEEVDLEDFYSEIDSDDDEAERRKALRKLRKCHKPVDGNTYTDNFYILIVVGVDPNYGIYHLAYAIVESENKQAWPWFLDCLRDELELVRNLNFTFVTDKQKGLIPALAETFPYVEHRFCLKHIYDNMKLQWRGQQFKDLLWKCAIATTVSYFNRNMEELKARPHCDVLLNNMCEVLNRQLKDGRDKPIITCLEFIREYLMKRIVIVQHVISKSNGPLTPKANKCVVNVDERTCSCRKWDLTDMPCKHKVGAIWNMAENGLEPGIPESWVHPNIPITYTPPEYHKPAGRPPKKRKKGATELFDGLVKNGKLSSPFAPAVNPSQTTPTMRFTRSNASMYSPIKNTASTASGPNEDNNLRICYGNVLLLLPSLTSTGTWKNSKIVIAAIIGMHCKHEVGAIWNMAENGLEPGILESWVHPSYWLATWEEMYRPPKKRKKGAAELFDGLVKNGKLSRFGQTVTCCKYGQKGHNSISCNGQKGTTSINTSAPAVNPSQSTQTTVNPFAPAVNPSQTTLTMRFTKSNASRYSPIKNTASTASGPSGRGKERLGSDA